MMISARTISAALLCACLLLPQARAAELTDVVVSHEDGRYRLTSTTYFDASQSQLYKVLTDYDQFVRFTTAFVETKNRQPDEQGRPTYYTRMEGCVLMFCKSYVRVGHLELKPQHDIVAIGDPEESNFKYSRERWQLIPRGDQTILIYDFEMEPAFWVPPVIGPFYIQRVLRRGAGRAVNRIEVLAQAIEDEQTQNEQKVVKPVDLP